MTEEGIRYDRYPYLGLVSILCGLLSLTPFLWLLLTLWLSPAGDIAPVPLGGFVVFGCILPLFSALAGIGLGFLALGVREKVWVAVLGILCL